MQNMNGDFLLKKLEVYPDNTIRSIKNWYQFQANVTESTTLQHFRRPLSSWKSWQFDIIESHPTHPLRGLRQEYQPQAQTA